MSGGPPKRNDEAQRWDARYASPGYIFGEEPSTLLKEQADLLPTEGRALDIAAGEGQNSVFLARRGLIVEAIDISAVGLRKAQGLAEHYGATIKVRLWDVKRSFLPQGPFDVVICMHYHQPDLSPRITASMCPGALLVMELNTLENLKLHRRPSRRYLLQPNELITWFPELQLLSYREGVFDGHGVAQLVARKP